LILFEEIGNASIALTLHNYSSTYDQSKTSGIYCVQFVYFKNDISGLKALNWWRERCLEWCFARLENGKFGDQKYLDNWTIRFDNVHVIKHLGAGLAPWNVQQFDILNINKHIIKNKETEIKFETIFYHYHNLKFKIKNSEIIISPSKFDLSKDVINIFYIPYIKILLEADGHCLSEFNILFLEHSIFRKFLNSLRLVLKKCELFRKINTALIKSSR
jgi:hypothetical protein